MTPPTLSDPPSIATPTIEELLRSFEDYAKILVAFQQAHPASDDGQSPFAVIGDEIALMATRREVLTRLKRNLNAFRFAIPVSPILIVSIELYSSTSRNVAPQEAAPGHPKTPEPIVGPSASGSLPTPPSGCADMGPATPSRATGSLINSIQPPTSPSVGLPAPKSASSPFRPLERQDAFYGLEMLQRYDFARGRSGRPSFGESNIHASPIPRSCDPQKPPVVAVLVDAPATSTVVMDAPSNLPNPETAVVTRVTRASARRINTEASGSSGVPSSGRKTHGKGKKRPKDDVDADGKVDGDANLPPAKRRKKLPVKRGGASK